MRNLVSKYRPPVTPHLERSMAPGAGLIVAGLASVILWAMIAGIVAVV